MTNYQNDAQNELMCEFCGKRYVKAAAFLNHTCEKKKRFEYARSPRGILAYQLYVKWLSKTKTRNCNGISLEVFLTSSQYKSFINFVEWGINTELYNFEKYIDFMVIKKYPPTMWTYSQVFGQFLEFLDFKMTADDHIGSTLKTLIKISQDKNISINQVIPSLMPGEIIHLVMKRKLSPWVLLKTQGFKSQWKTYNADVKNHISKVIKADYWHSKIVSNPTGNEEIKKVVDRLKL